MCHSFSGPTTTGDHVTTEAALTGALAAAVDPRLVGFYDRIADRAADFRTLANAPVPLMARETRAGRG